jgi:hypothetical protein
MKILILLLATTTLTSFSVNRDGDDINGLWMGYYRSEVIKEKVIVKFNDADKLEFYTGGIDDRTRCMGSYAVLGDSVSFTYKTPEGETIVMQGHFNRRKNFVDGTWQAQDKTTGSFYLEKQKIQEYLARP